MTQHIALDPADLEIARNRLESIAEEVGTALIRTSYSPNIKDRRDCSAGVYRAGGELIAQAEHIPLHLGLMPTLIRNTLAEIGVDSLAPGDVVITNNPYLGGSHLPDTCLITPVHVGGEVIAVVANMAHHVDVGGLAPGSMATHATEIFQEGIRIPPLRLIKRGEIQQDVLDLLLTNVRTADKTRGDLMAQVAANSLGARRIQELVEDWGVARFRAAGEALIDYAERRTRAALRAMPDGCARFADYLEHTGVREEDVPIVATVSKRGDELVVDLTECADQVAGAVNCSYAIAEACAAYAVKALADPTLPSNEGLMRPVSVRTRPGSVVAAQFPAPVSNGNTQTAQRIVDVLFGAFEQFVPDRVPAASSGSMSIVTIGGHDPETQRYFSYVETYGGGQGALPSMDGADAVHTHMTNTRNTPCEVIEREYPLRVKRYAIAHGTGGAGRFNGGSGLVRELEVTAGRVSAVVATARVTRRPWGLHGGEPGSPAQVHVVRNGSSQQLSAMNRLDLQRGETLSIQTAGGGGYGRNDD
ncbi:hydantoinase B/oxoprolinase family protein [Saccharopolyspora sp. ASAGF58]|uniref:hydantoinase B/oxoprolinase family protein n=1 Tax=Saccharopolyspora sp. ASAGF58 TaxID=2719023 RepID=UPI00143FEDBA|nr:hydantoinase B/oxoprolinase family protein [Saccharopolyspora sp. ASAGF58]QIZ37459.1 hydantoinase B/oxoprolinase family protein [Saccharopolyspora sp. ASAGF58]